MVEKLGRQRILKLSLGVGVFLLSLIINAVLISNTVQAKKNLRAGTLSTEQMQEFSQNNILYYDPTACLDNSVSSTPPTGDQITWIGDSYSVGAKSIIEDEYPGIEFGGSVNDANSYIQGCKNVATDTDCNANPTNPSALNVLKRVIDAGEIKPYLVMAVGTNEGWSDSSIATLKQLMSRAPDTKVVLVTSKTANSNYTESNERLRMLANTTDHYYLADWAAVSDPSYFASDNVHPTSNGGYEKWVETISNAMPKTTKTTGSLSGTGNFAKILSAKNADKSFFNGSGDVPSARWSDTDTGSMRQLLETYGDLAYQLGDVVGAPWIAILVQMRYEDPDSVCGRNNFWGNGCPPGTGVGGASKQGNNLGEGFTQYAETLTNGYHDQALGIADPKQYLEAIGPTWVQGDPNGPGYGSIDAMKNSVDALQSYADSSEGQAIVSKFGNYHGSSNNACNCDGELSGGKWEDGWLEDDSIEGIKKQDVNGASDLNEAVNPKGSYTTEDGKPNKILLHTTEGTTNGYDAYPAGNKHPAHFIVDLKKKEGYQNFSIDQPALAIKDYDTAGPIQIEIVGFSDTSSSGYDPAYDVDKFTPEDWDYLTKLLLAISEQTDIPLTSSVNWGPHALRMDAKGFTNYEGILGHMHVPNNDHSDPGSIWQYVEAAIDRTGGGGYNAACSSGGNGDINATAIELAWPASEYGQHGWSDPSPAYAKALVETGVNHLGDACSMAGGSCDAFVTTVMRYSGADPDFYCCGITGGATLNYILSSNKYTEVSNGRGNLQPGDIRIGSDHIELYVEVNGEPHIAAASHCNRSGDIGNYYDNDYRVFRLKK